MFAPTACTTPTRLPTLWWTLAVAVLLLSAFAPAFAAESPLRDAPSGDGERLEAGSWRVLGWDQLMRAALLRRADPSYGRMLPLAVLPSQRSALWVGLSANRTTGARIELRWTVPLDGGAPNLGALGG
ncbi:MAG TPA: hypothetical protein VFU71_16685 [Burkholderiaceae bacterium]|nr:hypothetical protein [Burkholderiaceae bacterium]